MKKRYLLSLVVVLMALFKMDVFALDPACTQAEQLRLRELANATQITYDFYVDNSEGEYKGYKVTISGFTADFYVYDPDSSSFFAYNGNPTVTVGNYNGGTTYKFPFYAAEGSPCSNMPIMTKNLSLVPYNPYSEDPLCVGHETYQLCKKFTPIVIASQKDFEQRMKKYIKSLEDKKDETPVEQKPTTERTILQVIEDFIVDNYMFFLISIIIVGTAGIVVIETKKRRSIL